ncbi:hypothetical protein CAPTEDRAFT_114336, partial [Capitella teleta]
FLLQDDNAPRHKAKKIKKNLDFEDVNRLPWPVRSLDMNPFDTLWATLSKRLINREIQSTDLDELRQYLTEECDVIPVETDHSNIDGMP